MEVRERIREIRQTEKLSREELYQRLRNIFGEKTIKPNSIWRIESGLTSARASSLHQICIGLGVSLKDLLSDITAESRIVNITRKGKAIDQFIYNQKARAEILSHPGLPFFAQGLFLLPGGITNTEEDPIEIAKFQKWVYCLSAKFDCIIGTEKHTLNKGDSLSFDSNIPHHFENPYARKARGIVIQNPKHI